MSDYKVKVELRDLKTEPPTEEENRAMRAEIVREIAGMRWPTMEDAYRVACRVLIRWWLSTMKVTPCEN